MVGEAEALIAAVMTSYGMSRDEALVVVVTTDTRERHYGRMPLVPGQPLNEVYAQEIEHTILTAGQAVRVLAHLQGLSLEEAQENLGDWVEEGTISLHNMH